MYFTLARLEEESRRWQEERKYRLNEKLKRLEEELMILEETIRILVEKEERCLRAWQEREGIDEAAQ